MFALSSWALAWAQLLLFQGSSVIFITEKKPRQTQESFSLLPHLCYKVKYLKSTAISLKVTLSPQGRLSCPTKQRTGLGQGKLVPAWRKAGSCFHLTVLEEQPEPI